MHFLLDENVPHSVGDVLRKLGHKFQFVVDLIPRGSPDPLVATLSQDMDAVLVSADKDFKAIAPRLQIGRNRYRRLSRVHIQCDKPQAAQRIEKAMSLIEAEFEIAQSSHDTRMIIVIGKSFIKTER